MTTLQLPASDIQMVLLIFVRVLAIFMSIPMFNSRHLPVVFKAGFAMAVSILLFPLLGLTAVPLADNLFILAIGVASEVLLGLSIGMFVRLLFTGVQLAGQLAGYQMGMALANVLDPATSTQVSLIAQFYNLFAVLIFISINAHYWFLDAMVDSFRLVPPFGFHLSASLMDSLIRMSANIFSIGIRAGAPVIAALLITSVTLGLLARTTPQMNIFFVAMPIKICIGLVMIMISLPHLASFLGQLFGGLTETIMGVLHAVK